MPELTSQRIHRLAQTLQPVARFLTESTYARRSQEPLISDFTTGNPHDFARKEFVGALTHWAEPKDKDWFAYKTNEPTARRAAAEALGGRLGLAFEPDDIFLTTGAFSALAVCLSAVVDPGDEVIFFSPPWFFYEALISAAGARPVRVSVQSSNFDLDLDALGLAITPRTRAVIVNTPHNPTGKVLAPETLAALGRLLGESNQGRDRPIFILSDEAYSRIVYDARRHHSPAEFYPYTCVFYTFGKTLLSPGQRLGYIALPATLPEREPLRQALFTAQLVTGYAFPNALLQHALPDLEKQSIDLDHLQFKRDRLVGALRRMGYQLHVPEGTFYLLPRSPIADDWSFTDRLAEHDVFVLPGSVVEMPGYFRISLTASDDMIERALPGFEAALAQAR